jgi:hypothetical protein
VVVLTSTTISAKVVILPNITPVSLLYCLTFNLRAQSGSLDFQHKHEYLELFVPDKPWLQLPEPEHLHRWQWQRESLGWGECPVQHDFTRWHPEFCEHGTERLYIARFQSVAVRIYNLFIGCLIF